MDREQPGGCETLLERSPCGVNSFEKMFQVPHQDSRAGTGGCQVRYIIKQGPRTKAGRREGQSHCGREDSAARA